MANTWGKSGNSGWLYFWAPKSVQMVTAAMKLNDGYSLEGKLWTNLEVKWSEVAQSCPTLCDPMDCSPWCSSIHRIFQARILEWVAISFSRRSSQPRDSTRVSRIVGRHFTIWATREVMTDLDSILKSRDIALPTKVYLVKAMVFPVVMYGCESWTI